MKQPNKGWERVKTFFSVHETSLLLSLSGLVIVSVALGGFLYATAHSLPASQEAEPTTTPLFNFLGGNTKEDSTEALPAVLPRRIDGIVVAREDANTVPVCVMIENAAFDGVRPQSGLSRASLVYEVIVEGGITRLMALFAGEKSDVVGPVRSARDTYLEFASEYNCAYIHAGGSFTALQALPRFGMRFIDALREPGYFWRDSSKYSPHNLFTSTDNLYAAVDDHSWNKEDSPSYTEWNFVDTADVEQPASEGSMRNIVRVLFGGSYNVEFRYSADHSFYERWNGGVLQHDAVNGEVITARNVVIQHVGAGIYIEGKGRVNWPVAGEGTVEIYHSGQKFTGTWRKESRTGRTEFLDVQGNLIPMARGNTWVEVVPAHISVEDES